MVSYSVARRILLVVIVAVTPLMLVIAGPRQALAATWEPTINRDFPDPTVLYSGGVYYAYSTQVSQYNVPFATSPDGEHWSPGYRDAMPTLAAWARFGRTWAPTVAENDAGDFVMFYAAQDAASGRQCIGEALSNAPAGPFTDTDADPVICDPSVGGDIDPDIFTDPTSGQSYLLWKLDGNVIGRPTSLWAVPLNPSLKISGPQHELLTNDQPWQAGLIEGPDMFLQDGTYYLFYTGNAYYSPRYAIGFATCASPLGPCLDSPDNPVLVGAGGMSGPGSPSLFRGPAGLEIAFSAWAGTVGYANGGYRAMYTASVSFESGVPRFDPVVEDASRSSYWSFGSEGAVNAFNSVSYGSQPLAAPEHLVGASGSPDGRGYWTVTSSGAVYAYGSARYMGGMNGRALSRPIVGIAATPDGGGYWLVAADGGIFAFGDAGFFGSMGGRRLNRPIVGMAADPANGGYWLTAADGGVFSFDAPYFGSTGNLRLNRPVVGIASTPDGGGYFLVASDGGVFSFGDASFHGSTGRIRLSRPVVGMATTPDGQGYWLVASDGGIFAFGDAGFSGSSAGEPIEPPIVAVVADAALPA
jgi:hypothetical protein